MKSARGGFEQASSGLMAAWLASGGAAEVAGWDERAAGADDRLQAGGVTRNPMSCVEGRLQAGGVTRNPMSCVEDGLQAHRPTSSILSCVEEGLQAGSITRSPFGCVDDGLRVGIGGAVADCRP